MNESVKLARIQKQIALMDTAKQALYNPVVELLGGLIAIEAMYPKSEQTPGQVTITERKTNYANPLWFVQKIFGTSETQTTTLDFEATQEQWAKNALMWIIIAQQLAPYAPGIAQGAGTAVTGIAGLLTKGVVK